MCLYAYVVVYKKKSQLLQLLGIFYFAVQKLDCFYRHQVHKTKRLIIEKDYRKGLYLFHAIIVVVFYLFQCSRLER